MEDIISILSNENIGRKLEEVGVNFSQEEIEEMFTKSIRLHFAVKNITDPLEACIKYIKGEISYGGRYY